MRLAIGSPRAGESKCSLRLGAHTCFHKRGREQFMWFRKITTLMYGALALCTSLAEAAPVKYDLDKPFAHASSPGGWFIFDRDTATFGGYSITFDDYGAPDYLV